MKSVTSFKTFAIAFLGLTIAVLQGCATSEKIDAVQRGDSQLTCAQLDEEFGKLDKAKADIESKKGVTGTNVVSTLFWLPGLAYTYYDAGQASDLIAKRRAHLTEIAEKKACPASTVKANEPAAETSAAPVAEPSTAAAAAPVKKTATTVKKPAAVKQPATDKKVADAK